MTVLAIIPARGGSQGLPGKNLADVGGKPLLAWTIEAARESGEFDHIAVSSDDRNILDTASAYGAEFSVVRPPDLASNEACMMPVVVHAIGEMKASGHIAETVVLLQPTSPLRSPQDIRECLALHRKSGKPVVSVRRAKANPSWMFVMRDDGTLTHYESGRSMSQRRQDLPSLMAPNGAIYVAAASSLSAESSFFDDALGYLMPVERSVDIDEQFDLEIVRLIVSARKNKP